MTGKLMKYEFRSVFKQIGVIWAALPAVAILTSFTGWIYARSALAQENDQLLGALLARIPMFLYVGLFIALVVATLFVVVMRFYKGLLKEEGYLMHTLPVKEWQLITSKGVTATVTVLISMVLAAVSIILLNLVGNLSEIGELFQAVGEACRKHPESFLYALEALLVVLVSIMTEVYKIYASLSIGQLMAKHRIIWSVAAYIGIGVAFTLLGSILLTTFEHPIMLISERIFTDFADNYHQIVQTVLGTAFLYFAVQIAIFHVVSERILSLKLNLE